MLYSIYSVEVILEKKLNFNLINLETANLRKFMERKILVYLFFTSSAQSSSLHWICNDLRLSYPSKRRQKTRRFLYRVWVFLFSDFNQYLSMSTMVKLAPYQLSCKFIQGPSSHCIRTDRRVAGQMDLNERKRFFHSLFYRIMLCNIRSAKRRRDTV